MFDKYTLKNAKDSFLRTLNRVGFFGFGEPKPDISAPTNFIHLTHAHNPDKKECRDVLHFALTSSHALKDVTEIANNEFSAENFSILKRAPGVNRHILSFFASKKAFIKISTNIPPCLLKKDM